MKKLLIIYGTTEGQTAKIVQYLEHQFFKAGIDVTSFNATEFPPEPYGYDMILLAGSLHMERVQTAVIDYAAKYKQVIDRIPNALIMVSLSAADIDKEAKIGLENCVQELIESTGWKPKKVEHVAGALKYVEYNFFKRFILKQISKSKGSTTDTSQDHEFTDWDELNRFTEEFLQEAKESVLLG